MNGRRVIDMTGQRFEDHEVIQQNGNTRFGSATWLLRCVCGHKSVRTGGDLRLGAFKGKCRHIKRVTERPVGRPPTFNIIPGSAGTVEYRTWYRMNERCYDPRHDSYPDYGGRGIEVAPEWREDFVAFYEYMGDRPGPGYSLDRIDNDGDYQPGNVRWATWSQQNTNKRRRRA